VAAAREDLLEKTREEARLQAKDLTLENGKVLDKAAQELSWKEAVPGSAWMTHAHRTLDAEEAEKPEIAAFRTTVSAACRSPRYRSTSRRASCAARRSSPCRTRLIINLLGCESQVAGGVIMGVNYPCSRRTSRRARAGSVNDDMDSTSWRIEIVRRLADADAARGMSSCGRRCPAFLDAAQLVELHVVVDLPARRRVEEVLLEQGVVDAHDDAAATCDSQPSK